MIYFIANLLHFFIFALRKPRVEGSVKNMRCIKIKYGLVWTIFVSVVIGLEFSCFYVTYNIAVFNRQWLEVLYQNKDVYECT